MCVRVFVYAICVCDIRVCVCIAHARVLLAVFVTACVVCILAVCVYTQRHGTLALCWHGRYLTGSKRHRDCVRGQDCVRANIRKVQEKMADQIG